MSKKLNRTEIATLAKRILEEVNEVNKAYNEAVKLTPAYIAEIARIEAKNPLKLIKEAFKKELKVQFGTKYKNEVSFSLDSQYNGTIREKEKEIEQEINDYNTTQLKKIYLPGYINSGYNQKIESIIDDITIAQIDISDVQMLINTIKSKLI